MTMLAKLNPFRELDEMQKRLGWVFGRTPLWPTAAERFTTTEWTPAVDVTEDEKEYLIKAELPEMKREDVKVTVEAGVLRITGERKFEKEEKTKKFHRMERAYGTFERAFTLPEGVKPETMTAEYKAGVLQVHLPKVETPKPTPTEVKVT